MKLNNKGYMLVEIIVSSAIALIMAYFLIDITLTLVNKNNDYYVESSLLSDKNLITKELMDDLTNSNYLLTDIVVGDDAKSATLKFKDLCGLKDDRDNCLGSTSLEKEIKINDIDNEIKYGSYTKKLSSDLNIKYINVTKDDTLKQLYISIPAYTNYSDIDYGINIVLPYTNEIDVVMPKFKVTLNVVNGSFSNSVSNSSLDVNIGEDAVFEGITPNTGYSLVKDSDTCNGILDSSGNYTIENVTDNKTCTLTLKKENNLDTSGANSPDLPQGLIPVMYKGDTWVVADYTNTNEEYKWYDYKNKQWANAVLVTETKRNSLSKDADGNYTKGQTIGDTETNGTLAFYVWIPRYKYKVWNINKVIGTASYDAYNTGIDIVFESGTSSTGTIECEYDFSITEDDGLPNEKCKDLESSGYYIHPAFTFGDDEVRGFWMGKFELSSSNSSADYGGGKSATLTARILPNVAGWTYNTISNYFIVVQNMQKSNNIYGLSESSLKLDDSHIITNMEWGAVAYLTNSDYGRCSDDTCSEVSINGYRNAEYFDDGDVAEFAYYSTKTGCGPNSLSGTTCNAYTTTLGMTASTTGNIYGIYDMSGGLEEYVMGNSSKEAKSYIFCSAGEDNGLNGSEFNSNWYTSGDNSKYVTTYAYGGISYGSQEAYNRGRLGDATIEVLVNFYGSGGWYADYAWFPEEIYYSWVSRGGYSNNGNATGIFNFNRSNASALDRAGSRAALVSLK